MAKNEQRKLTKNERKRLKAKQAKAAARAAVEGTTAQQEERKKAPREDSNDEASSSGAAVSALLSKTNVEVEYVSAPLDVQPGMEEFKSIFEKFAKPEELAGGILPVSSGIDHDNDAGANVAGDSSGSLGNDAAGNDEGEDEATISKRVQKRMSRLSVAELKQLVERPDVVEAHDVTGSDPRLLVYLKSYRNSVPVPRHWCHKRKYLQGKRGIEKPPWKLPEFIGATGIEKIRQTIIEQEAAQSAKQKGRGRVAPKMGKIDIDYQVMHDAFFKFQRKPPLTMHGDVYYEGKEYEVKLREKKPGQLSSVLREALAIPPGAPPPWLINMQRYGPPPAYPNLRVPGLNAPIPAGASFGYQPGEWGKPPVDDYGRPLYGDVFGRGETEGGGEAGPDGALGNSYDAAVDKAPWGNLVSESEESEEEEDPEDGNDQKDDGTESSVDLGDLSGTETPSGMTSVTSTLASGLDTPESIDLRKRSSAMSMTDGADTPESSALLPQAAPLAEEPPKQLYHVVEQQQVGVGNSHLFGVDKAYVLPGTQPNTGATNLEQSFNTGAHTQQTAEEAALLEMQRKRKLRAEKAEKDAKKKKKSDFKF